MVHIVLVPRTRGPLSSNDKLGPLCLWTSSQWLILTLQIQGDLIVRKHKILPDKPNWPQTAHFWLAGPITAQITQPGLNLYVRTEAQIKAATNLMGAV